MLLSDEEKKIFLDNIEATLSETPKTQIAATRIAKILNQVSSLTKETIKELVVSVMAESAKRMIFGG